MRVSRDDVQAAATRRRRDRLPRSGAGAGAGASSAGAAGEQKFYAEKLKPQELRNAKWFGEFKSSVYSLSNEFSTFF